MFAQFTALFALVLSTVLAPTPSPQAAADSWSVSVRIEPLNVTPTQYRCDATVTSLISGEHLVVNPVVVSHDRQPVVYIPRPDAKDRLCFFTASLAKEYPIVTWTLSVSQAHRPVLQQNGYVDLRGSCALK